MTLAKKPRARALGFPFEGQPGPLNAITDVGGVQVGQTTLIRGQDCRTGVTIIHPRGKTSTDPAFAGFFALNGNGELTGAHWIEEGGYLEGPIGITNTHNVGTVRDAIIHWQAKNDLLFQPWSVPVVGETADGWLNDMNRFHVQPHHVWKALENAVGGPVQEGNCGGGTGMVCYEFKGGTGTASRRIPEQLGGWTVGVLVQANFGRRHQLQIGGIPVGRELPENTLFTSGETPFREQGSIIIIIATDAPLLPYQLKRLARRAGMGLARTGSVAGNGSGDIFLAFSSANAGAARPVSGVADLRALGNDQMDPLFSATVYATEEAIINALTAAETMTGHNNITVDALPVERVRDILRRHNRLEQT